MKINDWMQELREQNTRLNTVQMGLVRESIQLEGFSITVSLGRQSGIDFQPSSTSLVIKIGIGETPRHLGGEFSTLFRKYNADFANMLDKIKGRVDEVVNAVTELFSAIVDQDIPELMIERMSGTQMGLEPQELVKKTTETRFKKLLARLDKLPKPFETISWEKTVAKKKLEIWLGEKSPASHVKLEWDDLGMKINTYQSEPSFSHTPALTQCLLFLANYEKIAKAVEKFATAIEASAKILAD